MSHIARPFFCSRDPRTDLWNVTRWGLSSAQVGLIGVDRSSYSASSSQITSSLIQIWRSIVSCDRCTCRSSSGQVDVVAVAEGQQWTGTIGDKSKTNQTCVLMAYIWQNPRG